MLPDNWLDIHKYHNKYISTLVHELEALFYCYENTPMKLFSEKDLSYWNPIIHGQQNVLELLYRSYFFSKEIKIILSHKYSLWKCQRKTFFVINPN